MNGIDRNACFDGNGRGDEAQLNSSSPLPETGGKTAIQTLLSIIGLVVLFMVGVAMLSFLAFAAFDAKGRYALLVFLLPLGVALPVAMVWLGHSRGRLVSARRGVAQCVDHGGGSGRYGRHKGQGGIGSFVSDVMEVLLVIMAICLVIYCGYYFLECVLFNIKGASSSFCRRSVGAWFWD